ncbi:MAG: diguanylate cyclase [Lachnospiraceae bacterium]|nr:diguanylate cyclase [Lachnospiraceae bacterium]
MNDSRKKSGLMLKFTMIYVAFTIVLLLIGGLLTYYSQMSIYKSECEEHIRGVGEYLAALMENEGPAIKKYQKYYLEHFDEIFIPYDFKDGDRAYADYTEKFAAEYPGQTLGYDIQTDDLSDEVKKAYYTFLHEYWILNFEKAREAFDIPYTYYLVMLEDTHDVIYMIDGERTTPNDHLKDGEAADHEDENRLYLGDRYHNDPKDYEILWKTWYTGQKQDGYKEFNNAWGHTYCYYTPVNLDGETLGIIGTEINVEKVNRNILNNTIMVLLRIGAVVISAMIILMILLHFFILKPVRSLEKQVSRYADSKDEAIAGEIDRAFSGNNEIDSLGKSFADMIRDLKDHMDKLAQASHDLAVTQQYAAEMDDLANKDSLTGVRNKLAYDKEVQRLERRRETEDLRFGIGVVDLNNLKLINDTWGHEKGDEAIKCMCRLICMIFAHSAVFRIGGDEFALIMSETDCGYAEGLISEFNRTIREIADKAEEDWQKKMSAAIGYSIYDPETVGNVEAVFNKADQNMYNMKKMMKTARSI